MKRSGLNRGVPQGERSPKGTSQKVINSTGSSRPGGGGPVIESSAPKNAYHIRGNVKGHLK